MVNVAVIGSRGYMGREVMRILVAHPKVTSIAPSTSGDAGAPYGDSVPAFRHLKDLKMVKSDSAAVRDADVHILATDAEEAKKAVSENPSSKLIIDLSRAHRHHALEGKDGWVFGLSDLRPVKKGAKRVANPGCYPTATLTAAMPALKAGLVGPGVLIADGKSGVSGAGATPRADLHYPEMNEATRAYKVLGHDHLAEIRAAAHILETEGKGLPPSGSSLGARRVRFTPHLVPMNRGLLSTVYLPLAHGATAESVKAAYAKSYAGSPFVHVVPEPDTANVRGSNFAHVAADVDAEAGLIVARCAIDNLLKGGSGQAIQNMNDALGYPSSTGLLHVGGGP